MGNRMYLSSPDCQLLLTASNESAVFFNHTFTDQPAMMLSVVTGLPLLFGAFICYTNNLTNEVRT